MTTDELPRLPVMFEWIMGQGPYKEADGSLYTFETGYRAYLAFQDVIFRRSPSSIEMRTGRQSQPVAQQPPAEPLPTAYDTIVYKMSSRSFHRALNEGVPIPGSNRLIIMDMPALPHHPPDERRGMRSKAVWRNLPPGYLSNTILKLFIEQVTGEQQRPVPVHEARISLVSPQGRKRPITHHWVFFNCVPAMYKSPDQSEGRARQRLSQSFQSQTLHFSLVKLTADYYMFMCA